MTKAEQCIAIYAELVAEHGDNHKAIRPEFIRRAVAEAKCTPAGAGTYYANCKNRGGATGETRAPVERDPNYVPTPRGVETNEPDARQLYSAVQKDKHGKVAHVAAYMNPTDAIDRAKKVRGIAVVGAPEIGDDVSTLELISEVAMAS